MIRKLLLPAATALLLAGCVTGPYGYQGGRGDYYYGRPSVEYRYYGSPYDGYYGHGGPYRHGYSFPWDYGRYYRHFGFYGFPHYYYHPRPRLRPHHPRPPVPPRDPTTGEGTPVDRGPPWRNIGRPSRPPEHPRAGEWGGPGRPPQSTLPPAPRPAVRPRPEAGSRIEQTIRQAGRDNARQGDARPRSER